MRQPRPVRSERVFGEHFGLCCRALACAGAAFACLMASGGSTATDASRPDKCCNPCNGFHNNNAAAGSVKRSNPGPGQHGAFRVPLPLSLGQFRRRLASDKWVLSEVFAEAMYVL